MAETTYRAIHPIMHSRYPGEPRYVGRDEPLTLDDETDDHVAELLRMGFLRPETETERTERLGGGDHG